MRPLQPLGRRHPHLRPFLPSEWFAHVVDEQPCGVLDQAGAWPTKHSAVTKTGTQGRMAMENAAPAVAPGVQIGAHSRMALECKSVRISSSRVRVQISTPGGDGRRLGGRPPPHPRGSAAADRLAIGARSGAKCKSVRVSGAERLREPIGEPGRRERDALNADPASAERAMVFL